MGYTRFFSAGTTEAASHAARILKETGIVFSREPGRDTTDLLLDVPSFDSSGNLRDGEDPDALFSRLSPRTRIWGGHLPVMEGFQCFDLLKDPDYLLKNAAITADCTLKIAAPLVPTVWARSRVLVIGWGRIGKALSKTLKLLDARVAVSARKASDRTLLHALGYEVLDTTLLGSLTGRYDLIINTVPAPVLGPKVLDSQIHCPAIDLASSPGLSGSRVIAARGLPGKLAPKASGNLIADTILRLGKGVLQ